ncbi:MAG: hypothetical protein H7Y37_18605 [Anaerolineae bacterium]|nr:hypothetical protein [Gloeobacterales cyanobacterium ES-bin-313]
MKTNTLKVRVISTVFILMNFLPSRSAVAEEPCADLSGQDRLSSEYLNLIRSAPVPYAQRNGFSHDQLAPSPPLHWNPHLARVARQKAQSMARYNYFAHTQPNGLGPNRRLVMSGYPLPRDYPLDSQANTVESLASGASNANEAIDQLVIDYGVPGAEHRAHLLATARPFRSHTEVGIGMACNPRSTYIYYYVILTAPPIPAPRTARANSTPTRLKTR